MVESNTSDSKNKGVQMQYQRKTKGDYQIQGWLYQTGFCPVFNSSFLKKKCIETFQACKKMEDKSVESVYYCMEDHSMSFINQTSESLGKLTKKHGNAQHFLCKYLTYLTPSLPIRKK